MTFEKQIYETTILEHHLDSFGHVNNATYLEILEEARWDFITRRGYGYDKVHELKVGPTILEVNLKFKKELRLREKIRVESQVTEYEGRIGKLTQEIKVGDTVHSVAVFTFGLFDINARRLIKPTDEWLKAVGLVGN